MNKVEYCMYTEGGNICWYIDPYDQFSLDHKDDSEVCQRVDLFEYIENLVKTKLQSLTDMVDHTMVWIKTTSPPCPFYQAEFWIVDNEREEGDNMIFKIFNMSIAPKEFLMNYSDDFEVLYKDDGDFKMLYDTYKQTNRVWDAYLGKDK